MVAPLTRKHTIEQTGFQLTPTLGGRYGIPTLEDRGVFFALLEHFVQLRW